MNPVRSLLIAAALVAGLLLAGGSSAQTQVDTDNDGVSDVVENYMGTSPEETCSDTPTSGDEAVDAWPSDADDNQEVNVGDQIQLFGDGKMLVDSSNPLYEARSDFDANQQINVGDLILAFGQGQMLTTCRPLVELVCTDSDSDTVLDTFEVVVGADVNHYPVGIDNAERLAGFDVGVSFNGTIETEDISNTMLDDDPDSGPLFTFSEPVPDSDGQHYASWVDFGPVGTSEEAGLGNLVTFTGAQPTITSVILVDANSDMIILDYKATC